MTRILFVHGHKETHETIRRSLYSVYPKWRVQFATDTIGALERLAAETFDAIVVDMDIPDVDGSALLNAVAQSRPTVLRVAVSGRYDRMAAYTMSTCSHMVLSKPFLALQFADMLEPALVVHRFELRRANAWLEDMPDDTECAIAEALPNEVRRHLYRRRMKRHGALREAS
jgi:DNA-binding NtrC family response regulator